MELEATIIEVRENFGDKKTKLKVFSRGPLSEIQKEYLSSLRRDDAIKYGNTQGWTVLDMSEWA